MKKLLITSLSAFAASMAFGQAVPAAFVGYNQDCIANGSGTAASSTTTTMDTIFDLYAVGFNTAAPTTGLGTGPIAGLDGNTYQLQNFSSSNVLLVGSGMTDSLTSSNSNAYSQLDFLLAGYNGSIPAGYKIDFADGSSTSSAFTAQDNFNSGYAYHIGSRVQVSNNGFQTNGSGPNFFALKVAITDSSAVSKVEFTNNSTDPRAFVGVWAVSGVQAVPAPAGILSLGVAVLGLIVLKRRSA